MDTIKALQIIMAALSAALIKEFYDTTNGQETTKRFVAETLMGTLLGTIVGFILQKYIQDVLYLMGLTAASSIIISGPEGLEKIITLIFKIKGIKLDIKDEDNNKK